jgi:hypothetical protein
MHGVLRGRLDAGLLLSCLVMVAAIAIGLAVGQHQAASGPDRGWVESRPLPLQSVPGAAGALATAGRAAPAPLAGVRAAATESLAPPAWVRPGTRVTFYSAAASVAQSRFAWVEDPDGNWEDSRTGKHYRRTDETGESMGWASGDGLSQIDVLAVDGTDVVLSLTLYGIDHETNRFVPGTTSGAEVAGGQIDGTWVNPARLADLENVRADGVLVLTGPYPLNGTTYDAISFAVTTPGAYAQYTYDRASGVLLAATTTTTTASSPPGSGTPGNTQLTVTFFAGMRQRSLPGLDGAAPGWVAGNPSLAYSGTYHWSNPVDPSSGAATYPMSMAVSLRPGGNQWASYSARTAIPAMGSSSTGNGVTGPTGLFWLSPDMLAGLADTSAGQLLDKDPVTGEQLTLQSVGREVTVESRLPGITSRMAYDGTTGVLTAYAAQVPGSGTTIDLRLTGTG